jgi:hypothetical protein
MKSVNLNRGVISLISILYLSIPVFSQDYGVTAADDSPNILQKKKERV